MENNETYFEDENIENTEPDEFDTIIGHIEDMFITEDFHLIMSNFMEKHWKTFDYSEENKLIYTDIFSEYTHMVEEFITNYLTRKIPNFSMKTFLDEIERRRDLDGEIFDILFTMSDFLKFKEYILDFRNTKEGLVDHLTLNF